MESYVDELAPKNRREKERWEQSTAVDAGQLPLGNYGPEVVAKNHRGRIKKETYEEITVEKSPWKDLKRHTRKLLREKAPWRIVFGSK